MNKMTSLYILLAALLAACQKPAPEPEPPGPTTKLPILWQVPLTPDTSKNLGEAQYVWNGNVIYGIVWRQPAASLEMRDSLGNLKWIYDDFSSIIGEFSKYGQVHNIKDNTIVNNWSDTYCLDNHTGALLWHNDIRTEQNNGNPISSSIDEYIYTIHNTGGLPRPSSQSLVRAHYLDGRWDTLATFQNKGDQYYLGLAPPVLWVKPNGDSILILRNNESYINSTPPPNGRLQRANLYAFNLRSRQFDWIREDVDPDGSISGSLLALESDRIYLNGKRTVHCVDLNTGADIWTQHFEKGVGQSSLVLHKGLLIVQSDWIGMWGLDKRNGNLVWHNTDTDGTVHVLNYFDGVVYCTSSGYARLYAVRAETGETIWKERSPNRGQRFPDASFFEAGIAIDTTRRVLYTADKYFLLCIKLPK